MFSWRVLGITSEFRGGDALRRLRKRAGLTTRQAAEYSQRIAVAEGTEEFSISHARLIQIENGKSPPSLYKLFSLSAIYGVSLNELQALYVNSADIARHRINLGLAKTRLVEFEAPLEKHSVTFPIRFDPAFSVDKTNLLSRMIQEWGAVPAGLLEKLNIRKARYGIIGLLDNTMSPLLRPGSFVQIEDQRPPTEPVRYSSEFERPIWFLELRDGYICSWCEFKDHQVVCIPHPLSGCRTREFAFPRDAEIVGRVTAVAARLIGPATPIRSDPEPQAQS
jgi:transcriptional regulator with XRE-family HTH domain